MPAPKPSGKSKLEVPPTPNGIPDCARFLQNIKLGNVPIRIYELDEAGSDRLGGQYLALMVETRPSSKVVVAVVCPTRNPINGKVIKGIQLELRVC
jgi:hypothetical protein